MSWPECKLGDYFEITSSKRVFQSEWRDAGVPFYRAREVVKLSQEGFVEDALFISREMYDEYKEKYGVPLPGDLLVTGVGTLGKVYIVKEGDEFYFKDGNIIWLKKKKEIDSRYLDYVLKTDKVQRFIQNAPGATVGTYTISKAKETIIPVPPIKEQKRIAAILDKADTIRRKRQQAIDLTNQLLRSIFLDMFGDPVTNSNNLPTSLLGDVSERVTDGTHQSPDWADTGVPFLFVSNIVNHEVTYDVSKYITEANWKELTKRCPIEEGDVLYTTVGSYGNAALVKENTRFCFQRHIAHIKPNKELINPTFLWAMMNSAGVKSQADKQARGIAQKTLNLKELKEFSVFVPSMDEQLRFVGLANKIKSNIEDMRIQSALNEKLFASLTQRAFRGELTNQTEAA